MYICIFIYSIDSPACHARPDEKTRAVPAVCPASFFWRHGTAGQTAADDDWKNIEPVKDYINPIKGYSNDVVNQYEDNSIDFLFIDASHRYEDVLNDINLWYHKVKPDGIIAGHDYNNGDFPGVVKAVDEFFGTEIEMSNWSWIYQKNIKDIPAHGRGGFIPAMNYIKENNIKNPVIVEIGTQRNFENTGDGCSTEFFSWFVNSYGGKLYSIDIEESYINNGKIELKNRKSSV